MRKTKSEEEGVPTKKGVWQVVATHKQSNFLSLPSPIPSLEPLLANEPGWLEEKKEDKKLPSKVHPSRGQCLSPTARSKRELIVRPSIQESTLRTSITSPRSSSAPTLDKLVRVACSSYPAPFVLRHVLLAPSTFISFPFTTTMLFGISSAQLCSLDLWRGATALLFSTVLEHLRIK